MFQRVLHRMEGFGFAQLRPGLYFGPRPPTGTALARSGVVSLALTAANHQPPDTDFPGVLVRRAWLDDSLAYTPPLRRWPRHWRKT